MPYSQLSRYLKSEVPASGETTSAVSSINGANVLDSALEALLKLLCGANGNLILAGCTISAAAGLSVDVVAGSRALIGGHHVYSVVAVNKAGLTPSTTNYIYLKKATTSKYDQSFTVEANTSGTPPADSILIATCVTDGSSVTSVNNDPTGRAPLLSLGSVRRDIALVVNQIAYTLPFTPRANSSRVFFRGMLLREGAAADYSISGTTLTLAANWAPAESEGYLSVEATPA